MAGTSGSHRLENSQNKFQCHKTLENKEEVSIYNILSDIAEPILNYDASRSLYS